MISSRLAHDQLRERIQALGFVLVGITQPVDGLDYEFFCEWLDRGYAGGMEYLPGRREAYRHPDSVLPGCRSILLMALPYRGHPRTLRSKHSDSDPETLKATSDCIGQETGRGTIASYAASSEDYHDVIHGKLKSIVRELERMYPGTQSRGIVDTAPLLERRYAQRAGLGWIGKNTLLLHRELGSYFFLAAVLTQVLLEPNSPWEQDHCGSCRACLDACPTDAFVEPRVLDATRCISYWTIEHRGLIPEAMRPKLGDWMFGCDACQTVCPWNRQGRSEHDRGSDCSRGLQPDRWTDKTDCLFWLRLDESSFRRHFRHTPFWRTRLQGMQRNALIVAANTRCIEALPEITRLSQCDDSVLAETAKWSLGVLCGSV